MWPMLIFEYHVNYLQLFCHFNEVETHYDYVQLQICSKINLAVGKRWLLKEVAIDPLALVVQKLST